MERHKLHVYTSRYGKTGTYIILFLTNGIHPPLISAALTGFVRNIKIIKRLNIFFKTELNTFDINHKQNQLNVNPICYKLRTLRKSLFIQFLQVNLSIIKEQQQSLFCLMSSCKLWKHFYILGTNRKAGQSVDAIILKMFHWIYYL